MTGSSTTSCGHKIQPWRDGSCSSLWTGGLKHRLLRNISAHRASLLHCAPCAVGSSALQPGLGKPARGLPHLPAQRGGVVAMVMGPLFLLCAQKDAFGRLQHRLLGTADPLGSWRAPGTQMSCTPQGLPCHWLLWALSTALCCHPSIAHTFIGGFLPPQPNNASFSESKINSVPAKTRTECLALGIITTKPSPELSSGPATSRCHGTFPPGTAWIGGTGVLQAALGW